MAKAQKKPSKTESSSAASTSKAALPWQVWVAIAVTGLFFFPSLSNGFVNWDDDYNVLNNPYIKGLTAENIKGIFTTTVIGNYNPLPIFTFAIEHALVGLEPKLYHFNNWWLHLLNTYFVFLLVRRLGLQPMYALVATLLFSIHPLRVESVAWVTERKDVLFAAFFLPATLLYLRWLDDKKSSTWIWMIVLFILALFSKIQAVAFPLTLLAIDYWKGRNLSFGLVWEKALLFGLSLAVGALGVYFLSQEGSLDQVEVYSFGERLLIGAYSLVVYLIKFVLPYEVCPLYPYPKQLGTAFYVAPLGALAVLGFSYWAFRKNWRTWVFGFGFFFVNVVFMLQIVGAGQGFIADRFTYIPYIGLAFASAWALQQWLDTTPSRVTPVMGALSVWFLILGGMTWKACKVWENGFTLWSDVEAKYANNSTSTYNLGHYFREIKDFDKSFEWYSKALAKNSTQANMWNSRGKLLFENNRPQEAIQDYNRGIAIDSSIAEIFVNRGACFGMLGNQEAALKDLNKGIAMDPNAKNGYSNRSILFVQMSQFDKAIADYESFLRLDPNNSDILAEKGSILRTVGRAKEGLTSINQAIQLDPNKGVYYKIRAEINEALGQTQAAAQDRVTARGFGVE